MLWNFCKIYGKGIEIVLDESTKLVYYIRRYKTHILNMPTIPSFL